MLADLFLYRDCSRVNCKSFEDTLEYYGIKAWSMYVLIYIAHALLNSRKRGTLRVKVYPQYMECRQRLHVINKSVHLFNLCVCV